MNIYEKLQACRVELQSKNLKKSGNNKYAGYTYYELSDFMPEINKLQQQYKLFSSVSFDSTFAMLTVVDSEKPESTIAFTCPMSSASLKGCHEVQNLGAVITYTRRYLYTLAFEINESDVLDGTTGQDKDNPKTPPKNNDKPKKEDPKKEDPKKNENPKSELSSEQIERLWTIAGQTKQSKDDVHLITEKEFGKKSVKELTIKEYDRTCNLLTKDIWLLAQQANQPKNVIYTWINEQFNKPALSKLTKEEYQTICNALTAAGKKAAS